MLRAAENAHDGEPTLPRAHRFFRSVVDGVGTTTPTAVERARRAVACRRSIALDLFDVLRGTLAREGDELVLGRESLSGKAECAVHVLPKSINCDNGAGRIACRGG